MKFKLSILVFLIVTIFSISCDSKEIDSKSKDLDNDISDEIVNNNLDRLDIEEDLTLINYTDESNSFSLGLRIFSNSPDKIFKTKLESLSLEIFVDLIFLIRLSVTSKPKSLEISVDSISSKISW